ncbi:MAG: hypothetical protein ACOY3Z_06280 [Thermodesulfobacteriota bacterium]
MKPTQLNLFEQSTLATVVRDVKSAMNQAARDSGYSREQLLDRMNTLAGRYGVQLNKKARELSKDLFEKWLNVNEPTHYPHLAALSIFCAATGNIEPIAIMLRPMGGMAIGAEDVKLLKWARAYHQAKGLRKKMRDLEADLP